MVLQKASSRAKAQTIKIKNRARFISVSKLDDKQDGPTKNGDLVGIKI